VREATSDEVKELRAENRELKEVVAEVTTHESQFESDAIWTPTSLHEQLGPHFEKKTLGDGYAVPGA
jgi:hypothetical protein